MANTCMHRFLFWLVLSLVPLRLQATDYYVSPRGDDNNPGTSSSRPWQTIAKVNSRAFKPGDLILLEGGQSFSGNLAFDAKDAGIPARPMTVGSYGEGRAEIQAGSGTGILIENAGGFIISNLIVTSEDRTVNNGDGISVVNRLDGGTRLQYIRIDNVEVSGFGGSGIVIRGEAADGGAGGFDDVRISRCRVRDNAHYGILVTGASNAASAGFANRRVYIGHCRAYDNPGDPEDPNGRYGSGILVEEADGALIERCAAFNNGYMCAAQSDGPSGIRVRSSNNVTVQHCESYNNRTAKSSGGGGFSFEAGVSNSLVQYNYSHDNDGAGFLFSMVREALRPFHNDVVRFNISENDARRNSGAGIFVSNQGSGISNLEIHNNDIYIAPSTAEATQRALAVHGSTRVHFRSNVFVTAGGIPMIEAGEGEEGLLFQGNDYWAELMGKFIILWADDSYDSLEDWRAATMQESVDGRKTGMSLDPLFTRWGQGVTVLNADFLEGLEAYRLKPGSPLLGTGLDLLHLFKLEQGPMDFFGNALSDRSYSIGAHIGK